MALGRKPRPPIYGLMAEFDEPHRLIEATEHAYAAGYRRMDAYTPYPIEGLAEALGKHYTRLGWIVLAGALTGALGGYGLAYYASVVSYPFNVGGKPFNSWQAFVPVIFECTILAAAFSAVLGMLGLNGLPQPYHPVFNVPRFALASRNRFFLCIESRDAKFDREGARKFLEEVSGHEVYEVEW